MDASVHFTIRTRRLASIVFVLCLLLELAFVLLDYHVNYARLTDIGAIRRLTNIAREDGLASWFATTQTLLVGLTAWVMFAVARAGEAPTWRRAGWFLVAAVFTYMAVDDGAQIHERVGSFARAFADDGSSSILDRFPSYSWQVIFLPVFTLTGLAVGTFMWREIQDRWARRLIFAAAVCFAVAVGLDFLEGLEPDHPWNAFTWVTSRVDIASFTEARFRQSPYNTLDHFTRSFEEFLEMFANTIVWVALLRSMPALARNVRCTIQP